MKGGFLIRVGAMVEEGKFRVEKFNDQKYQLWKMQMEDYIYANNVFLPLGIIENKLTTVKDKEREVLDRNTLGTIRMCLAASMIFNISKEKKMRDMMKALTRLYEKPSTSNKVFLMKCLFNMKMSKVGLLLII
jgi:hypothetical protein